MKIYLAGPMTGLPQFNFPAFFQAEAWLKAQGHNEVFSPARADIERTGDDSWWKENTNGTHDGLPDHINYRDCLRVDMNWIIDHAEAIALLPGWENSKGARAEHALAFALGLTMIYLPCVPEVK